jgi:hypothetical protein
MLGGGQSCGLFDGQIVFLTGKADHDYVFLFNVPRLYNKSTFAVDAWSNLRIACDV